MSGTVVPQTSVEETHSRRFSAPTVLTSFGVLLALTAFASLAVGPTGISIGSLPRAIAAVFGHAVDASAAREQLVLIDIRLPRTLLAMFVGASLRHVGRHDAGHVPQSAGRSGAHRRVVRRRARSGGDNRARPRNRCPGVAAARRLRAAGGGLPRRAS